MHLATGCYWRFIALLLTVYDSAIYGNCEYKRHDYSAGEYNFSTFELRLPAVEAEKCEASMGYKLMKYSLGHGWEKKILILFEIPKINDYLNIALSLLYVIMFVIVFYYFIQSVNEFASDLVSGVNMAAVTVNPNAIIDKAKNIASAIIKAKTGDKKGAVEDATKDTSSNKKGKEGLPIRCQQMEAGRRTRYQQVEAAERVIQSQLAVAGEAVDE